MNKRARLNYINALSQNVEHKKMYKAKKQWVVAGISFLVATGLGAVGSHLTTHADTTQANAQTTLPINKGSQSKQIGSAASNLHNKLVGNAASKTNQKPQISGSNTQTPSAKTSATPASSKVSGSQVSSSNAKSSVASNVATSSNDMNTLKLGNSSEQNKGWNYVQNDIKPSSNSNKPLMKLGIEHDLTAPSPSNSIQTGTYDGLNYQYDPSTQTVTFVSGTLMQWNPNNKYQTFIGNRDKAPKVLHEAKNIEFSNNIKMDPNFNNSNFTNMFLQNPTVQYIKLSNAFNTVMPSKIWTNFAGDGKLKIVDLTGLNTSKASDWGEMFGYDTNLQHIIGLNTLDTSDARIFTNLFSNDPNLQDIDLSSFDTTRARQSKNGFGTNGIANMIVGDSGLKTIKLGNKSILTNQAIDGDPAWSYAQNVNSGVPFGEDLIQLADGQAHPGTWQVFHGKGGEYEDQVPKGYYKDGTRWHSALWALGNNGTLYLENGVLTESPQNSNITEYVKDQNGRPIKDKKGNLEINFNWSKVKRIVYHNVLIPNNQNLTQEMNSIANVKNKIQHINKNTIDSAANTAISNDIGIINSAYDYIQNHGTDSGSVAVAHAENAADDAGDAYSDIEAQSADATTSAISTLSNEVKSDNSEIQKLQNDGSITLAFSVGNQVVSGNNGKYITLDDAQVRSQPKYNNSSNTYDVTSLLSSDVPVGYHIDGHVYAQIDPLNDGFAQILLSQDSKQPQQFKGMLGSVKPMMRFGFGASQQQAQNHVIRLVGNNVTYNGNVTLNFYTNDKQNPIKTIKNVTYTQAGEVGNQITLLKPSDYLKNSQLKGFDTNNYTLRPSDNSQLTFTVPPTNNPSVTKNVTLNYDANQVSDVINYDLSGNNIPNNYQGQKGILGSISNSNTDRKGTDDTNISQNLINDINNDVPANYYIVSSNINNLQYDGKTHSIEIAPNPEKVNVTYTDQNNHTYTSLVNGQYEQKINDITQSYNLPDGYQVNGNQDRSYKFTGNQNQSKSLSIIGKAQSGSVNVISKKYDGSKYIGQTSKSISESGLTGNSFTIDPTSSQFEPAGYSSQSQAYNGTFTPTGLSTGTVTFNYKAGAGEPIYVTYKNQNGKNVGTGSYTGTVDQTGNITDYVKVPNNYNLNNGQNYSFTTKTITQNMVLNVTGKSANATINFINQHGNSAGSEDVTGMVGNTVSPTSYPRGYEAPSTPTKYTFNKAGQNSAMNNVKLTGDIAGNINGSKAKNAPQDAKTGYVTVHVIEKSTNGKLLHQYTKSIDENSKRVGDSYTVKPSNVQLSDYDVANGDSNLTGTVNNDGSLSKDQITYTYTVHASDIEPISITYENQNNQYIDWKTGALTNNSNAATQTISDDTLAKLGGVGDKVNITSDINEPTGYHFSGNKSDLTDVNGQNLSQIILVHEQAGVSAMPLFLDFETKEPNVTPADSAANNKINADSSVVNSESGSATSIMSNEAISGSTRTSISNASNAIASASSAINNDSGKGASAESDANDALASAASAYTSASTIASSAVSSASASESAGSLASLISNDVNNATKNIKPATVPTSLTSGEVQDLANEVDANMKSTTSVVTNTVVDSSALTSLTNEVASENQEISNLANKPASNTTNTIDYNYFNNLVNSGVSQLTDVVNKDFKADIHDTAKAHTTNITKGFKPVKKHIRWIMITKPVKLYNRHGVAKTLRPSKVTLDVHSVYKVHGHFVFKVSYHHHTYFMADNHSTFKNAYLAQGKFAGRRVRVTKPVYEFRHKDHDIVKLLHKGSALRIRRVVKIGNFNMTRIQLSNGNWISANKNYIKVL